MYMPGFPAPVVTTGMSLLITTSTSSLICGDRSIRFTPKGLVVSSFAFLISFLNISGLIKAEPIIPRPPAFDTAAASSAVETHAIPPCKSGYLIFRSSHILDLIIYDSPYLRCQIILVIIPDLAHIAKSGLPSHQCRCPCQSSPKCLKYYNIVLFHPAVPHCLIQCHWHRCSRGIPVSFNIQNNLLHRHLKPFYN